MCWARFLNVSRCEVFLCINAVCRVSVLGFFSNAACLDVFAYVVWFSSVLNRLRDVSPRVCICVYSVSVFNVLFVGGCLCAVVCLRACS